MQSPEDASVELARLSDDGSLDWGSSDAASFNVQNFISGRKQLNVHASGGPLLSVQIPPATIWRATRRVFFLREDGSSYALRCASDEAALRIAELASASDQDNVQTLQGGTDPSAARSSFDRKTDAASADIYFKYYGMLQHQQNMLQDFIRTGTYNAAILENKADFEGKTVMDVGAGSGILSLFASQAGAAKVYAVEASDMAQHAQQLADLNPELGARVEVVKGRVEDLPLDVKVDVLISEPMGTLLVNERMLETYLYARKRFLKPGGKMFPQIGRIHVAAFSDEALYGELVSKAAFWLQGNFYGINVSQLHGPALSGYFQQVVVDAIDPTVLVSRAETKLYDFAVIDEEELFDITIPLNFKISCACAVHGVACWFDVLFNGSTTQRWLSTAPGQPTTHWFQLRCVLENPIMVSKGQDVTGELRLKAHSRQSYDVHLTLTGPPLAPGHPPQQASGVLDLKEPYYRQLNSWAQSPAQQQQQNAQAF